MAWWESMESIQRAHWLYHYRFWGSTHWHRVRPSHPFTHSLSTKWLILSPPKCTVFCFRTKSLSPLWNDSIFYFLCCSMIRNCRRRTTLSLSVEIRYVLWSRTPLKSTSNLRETKNRENIDPRTHSHSQHLITSFSLSLVDVMECHGMSGHGMWPHFNLNTKYFYLSFKFVRISVVINHSIPISSQWFCSEISLKFL